MIKSTSDLGYSTEPVPTIETWADFQKENLGGCHMAYVDATYDMLQKLEKVVEITDFTQLKEELTKLYSERYEFVAHALDNPW